MVQLDGELGPGSSPLFCVANAAFEHHSRPIPDVRCGAALSSWNFSEPDILLPAVL